MPYNAIYSNFSQMVSYKLGNIVIDLPMMTIIAYIFMMVIALLCAKKTYSKHQVEYVIKLNFILGYFWKKHIIVLKMIWNRGVELKRRLLGSVFFLTSLHKIKVLCKKA